MSRPEVSYTIVSAPKSIRFTCPHCNQDVEIDVRDLSVVDIWEGGYEECPECHKEVYLSGWQYD